MFYLRHRGPSQHDLQGWWGDEAVVGCLGALGGFLLRTWEPGGEDRELGWGGGGESGDLNLTQGGAAGAENNPEEFA